MKALILAAGYATRLYPLTLNKPKPLLPINNRPVIEYIIRKTEEIEDMDEIFIVTNQKFHKNFEEWSTKYSSPRKIVVINDRTKTNEDRIGATGDIELVIREKSLKDDLLVLAGDNIFKGKLAGFIDFSISKRPSISVGLYDVKDLELAKKYGVVSLGNDNSIIEFEEKPTNPTSTLAAKCLYFFPKEKLYIVKEYLSTGLSKDAPGYFLQWLSKKEVVFGYVFGDERWFDIGDMKSYKEADREFQKQAE